MVKSTVEFTHNNPDIIFTRADKGNVTVALERNTYNDKMEELLQDRETYSVIQKNPALSIERNLNEKLKKWLRLGYISKKEYFYLHSSDSNLPKAYGLPKIHKANFPFRIIISSVNTALYSLAKFINKIIKDNLPRTTSHVNNSFEVYDSLCGLNLNNNFVITSFDVISLFTNVPMELAVEGINKRRHHFEHATKIPMDEFLLTIKFILTSTYFTFNNTIYKQTYGTPMGSPLSPIIAEIVMQDLEENVLRTLNLPTLFYYRYVDDIVFAARDNDINQMLAAFNNYHPRLKFTSEKDEGCGISFLDLLLYKDRNMLYVDWFHKDTFSGRYLSFFSHNPLCHKIGTIYSLLDRAILLSMPHLHKKNIELCIKLLMDNGYPLELIFNTINRRLKKLFVTRRTNGPNQEKKVIVFPYIKPITEMMTSTINKAEHIIGYRCLNKLNQFIKTHKDREPRSSNNNVVYKISCKNCEATYVGQTKRQLKTRIKEHVNNIRLDPSKHSVVSEHIINFNHNFDWENVIILDHEHNYYKRMISEMIHIKEQNKGLNCMNDTDLLDNCYFEILNTLSHDLTY